MRYKSPSFSFVIASLLVCLAGDAFALDPEEADLVSSTTVDAPAPYDEDEDGVVYLGIDECERMLRNDAKISVTFETTYNPTQLSDVFDAAYYFEVARNSGARIDCESGDLCTVVDSDDIDYGERSISFEVAFTDLTGLSEEAECTGFDNEYFLRATLYQDTVGTNDTLENADGKIVVDTVRPSAPSGLEAAATENKIEVSFEGVSDDDVSRYTVFWSENGFDGGSVPDTDSLSSAPIGDQTSGDVTVDLDPGSTVFVGVAARDENGNYSVLSGAVEVSVVETNDFWESYKGAGGSEEGGCSTAAGPTNLWPLLLLGFVVVGRRRRRRELLATALLVGALAAPSLASAESKTYGALGLKAGTYYPNIDEEFGGEGPFSETFGTKNLLIGELELVGWIYQGIGKAGLGGSVGFSKVKGSAFVVDPDADGIEETTTFGIIPLRAFAAYRFDWLAQHTKVPLSLELEAGLDFYRWRIADAAGDTAEFDGQTGSGWKRGWHWGAQLQLLLDFIQPAAAAAMDMHWGVNNSYFFVEYLSTKVDNFGQDGFDLSDNLWLFGLNFEF